MDVRDRRFLKKVAELFLALGQPLVRLVEGALSAQSLDFWAHARSEDPHYRNRYKYDSQLRQQRPNHPLLLLDLAARFADAMGPNAS